jgi:CelD/BcsL family acetyltransferase involved in cellulose biosynthesis
LRLVVLQEIPEDAELRRRWNELVQHVEDPQVFYTNEWAFAVQYAFAKSLKPLLFLGYEGESLAGIVALAEQPDKSHTAVFLTSTTADYCDFLSEPGQRDEFVAAVLAELKSRQIGKMVLANLPADSFSVGAISRAASISHYHLLSRPAYLCARVVMGSAEQRTARKQATLAKKMLRRNMRDMEKMAPVTFRHDTLWEEIEPALQSYHKAHIARFLATGRLSNHIRSERRIFLYELARRLSLAGWLTLSRLFIAESPAAWNYGFQFAGGWFWYQPTLASVYEDYSPGFCLLSKIVETECDRPELDIVDLGLGAEGYKDRFATSNRQTLHLTLNQSLYGHVRAVARNYAAAVATASPRMENWIRHLISYRTRLRTRLRETGVLGLFTWLFWRIWKSIFAFSEVLFFEWPDGGSESRASGALTLRALDFDLAAAAAMHYADEPFTLDYLVRSAQRLRAGNVNGFVLVTTDGTPVHFCWVKDFAGFQMEELERTLQAPDAGAVLIFDCFTPPSTRGNAFFATAISLLAEQLRLAGKAPWIFGAGTNHASIHGIEKSGFTYRFSLGRKRILFMKRRQGSVPLPRPSDIAHTASAP